MANPVKKKKKSKGKSAFGGNGSGALKQANDEVVAAEKRGDRFRAKLQERSFQDRVAAAGGLIVGQAVAVNAAEVARINPAGMGAAINFGIGAVGATIAILVDHPGGLAAGIALGQSATAQTAISVFTGTGIYGKRSKDVKVTVVRPEPKK